MLCAKFEGFFFMQIYNKNNCFSKMFFLFLIFMNIYNHKWSMMREREIAYFWEPPSTTLTHTLETKTSLILLIVFCFSSIWELCNYPWRYWVSAWFHYFYDFTFKFSLFWKWYEQNKILHSSNIYKFKHKNSKQYGW